jgi:ABC-type transport system involved in Fe-S cluster assembly fused permease/ATPase subunit
MRVVVVLQLLPARLQWRTQFRKDMNRSEAQANNRAIDSLINYETVKYCGNEEHEVARYDECMHKYQVCVWVLGRGLELVEDRLLKALEALCRHPLGLVG